MALSCLMSYNTVSNSILGGHKRVKYLLERFVVDKTSSVLGNVKLSFLKVLPELPNHRDLSEP